MSDDMLSKISSIDVSAYIHPSIHPSIQHQLICSYDQKGPPEKAAHPGKDLVGSSTKQQGSEQARVFRPPLLPNGAAGQDDQGVDEARSNVEQVPSATLVHLVPAMLAGSNGDDNGGDDCSGAPIQHPPSQLGLTSCGGCPSMSSSAAPFDFGRRALSR